MVARVNGVDIRQSDLQLAEEDVGADMQAASPEAKREHLISYLADIIMVTQAADKKKLADSPEFKRRLAFLRNKLLMGYELQEEAKAAVNDETLQQTYNDAVKSMGGQEEVRARHILVESEDEAKALQEQLKSGADFATLAKEKSKDPGAAEGGDLGYFTKDQMVPEFADVAFKMYPGQVSNPVKTQFGWHLIKLEDKRTKQPPEFDKVKDQIEAFLDAQGADRIHRQAAADGQGRAPRQTCRARTNSPGSPSPRAAPDSRETPCRRPSRRSHPRTFPTCCRWRASSSRPPQQASAIPAASTCCWRCSMRARRVAGVFTRSKCPSAPVDWCRAQLKGGRARVARGQLRQRQCLYRQVRASGHQAHGKLAAAAAGCSPSAVFLASTGVIGEPLDAAKFGAVMDQLVTGAAPGAWQEAAEAIMTTDTFPKGAAAIARLGATPVTICGIAKGAGMIAPDMATMLSFVFTDAPISPQRAANRAQAGSRRHVQCSDDRRRHLDLRYAAGVRDRRGRRAWRAKDHDDVRPAAAGSAQGL